MTGECCVFELLRILGRYCGPNGFALQYIKSGREHSEEEKSCFVKLEWGWRLISFYCELFRYLPSLPLATSRI